MMPNGVLVERLRDAGAQVVELGSRRSLSAVSQLHRLGKAVQDAHPDLVQGWMYHGNLAASAISLCRYTRAPVIWAVRQRLERLSDNRLRTRLVILASRAFASQPRRILYNSIDAAMDHSRFGYPLARAQVVPNAVDCERFKPRPGVAAALRRDLGLDPTSLLVGRIGRNAAMKGNGMLLTAFKRIAAVEPRAHLVLIGPSMTDDDPQLNDLVDEAGLRGRVHRLGAKLDIENFYPAFDLVISSSSNTEGFPNVIAEAAASGTPVVATDVGESRSILRQSELLVAPGDVAALTRVGSSVLALTDEQKTRLGRTLRAGIVERYAVQKIIHRYLTIWRECVDAPAQF